MLELNFLRVNTERVKEGLRVRNFSDEALSIVDDIINLDDRRKATQTELDSLLAERNTLSREIGELFKSGQKDEAEQKRSRVNDIKEEAASLEDALKSIKAELDEALYQVPNIPHPSVPKGSTEDDNEVYKAWAKDLPEMGDDALPHWELAKKYNLFDLELGTKITGSGFPLYRGKGARLQRALISFFLDEANRAGYEEILPPLIVNEDSARATGQLPDKEGQMYHIEKDGFYLIPTGEVPITNIFRDEILSEDDFPVKLTGYTPCFRREAGSYGAHVRGLNRVHQFDKVEIVRYEHPDRSYEALEEMLAHVGGLLDKLGLPYRILRLCGGDLGFTAALTFDFEVYSAAQQRWLEVSSVSNFETYQSNRMKLRFKDGKSTRLAHTLNGSALALARIFAALLENNQTANGIIIPKVLQSYTGFDLID
ncbi:MAG: serine--tRNA ligase [Phaeodactylibacter xiamenensis]|uniref:Serine--tRNA ligase n=1 Tax=Phaeodactylibacter xiamenensis TaxID=1524460 RepID=A0A098SBP7_9BACT|nr:serine--tRNA ligase [Phaeodactylibacter xiamenensis]KGE88462.1 seryl-tRNA synthetase [Phaeodactylibacter xiamenensis]MCR9053136.1 serine--tRNA ligase [bacterium]